MMKGAISSCYAPLPELAIRVMPDVPAKLKRKIELELFNYCAKKPKEEVVIVSGYKKNNHKRTIGLQKTGIYKLLDNKVEILHKETSSLLLKFDLPLHILVSPTFPFKYAWKIIENAYKHVALMEREAAFIHGCGFLVQHRPVLLVGWSGTAKTYLAIEALTRGMHIIAEEFLIVAPYRGETMIFPYVPAHFGFELHHLRSLNPIPRKLLMYVVLLSMLTEYGHRIGTYVPILKQVVESATKRWSHCYLDWKKLIPGGKIVKEPVSAKDAYWCILVNQGCKNATISSRAVSSERVKDCVRISILQQMGIWLQLLQAIEYIGYKQKGFSLTGVEQRVNKIINNIIPPQIQGVEIRVPFIVKPGELMNQVLYSLSEVS